MWNAMGGLRLVGDGGCHRSGRLAATTALSLLLLVSPGRSNQPPQASVQAEQPRPGAEEFARLVSWVQREGGTLSARVVDLAHRRVLLEHGAETPVNPASNMKLVTAAAALDLLGPNYRFQTGLYGKRDGDSIQALVLRGQGDPTLEERDMWRLANALARMGVKKVHSLLVDQSHFDDQFVPPAFEQQPDEWSSFRAPISAVALERNTATLNVLASSAGAPATAWFEPSGVVRIEGTIDTKGRGSGNRVQLKLETREGVFFGALGGSIAENTPRQRYPKRLGDPRLAPGLNLKHHLQQLGVEVREVRLGGSGEKSRITYTSSPPLSEIVRALGKDSDNFTAEMLFKTLAETNDEHPRTSAGGARSVQAWLDRLGARPDGTTIVNGSGLFDANRLSASTLVQVLSHAYDDPRLHSEYIAQLAIGGVDGTLRSRFRDQRQSRAVRAKTGTLRATISLSGYTLLPGSPIAFAFLVDGIEGKHSAIRQRIDAVVSRLAKR